MYNFIDTTESQSSVSLPSEALRINGEYIEDIVSGYRTLYVSGREALSPELKTFETGIRDGSKLAAKRYPARTLRIGYQIIARNPQDFRDAYNELAAVLDTEESMLIFEDEQDKFFIGTPSGVDEVEPGRTSVTAEFEILCTDPFKYSIEEYEATLLGAGGVYTVNDDFGGDAMDVVPSGAYASYAVGQILLNTVLGGVVTLVGEGASEYKFGMDYVFDSATNTVYVTEKLLNDSMDYWQYDTQDNLSGDMDNVFLVDYQGTYRSYPTFEVIFPEGTEDAEDGQVSGDACGFIAFLNEDKKIIQIGNPDEQDIDVVKTTAVTSFSANWHLNALSKYWRANDGIVSWISKATGSVSRRKWAGAYPVQSKSGVGSLTLLRPTYGSGTSKTWHGPTITRPIPKDKAKNLGARNFELTWKQIMAMGSSKGYTKQLGRFACWLVQNKDGARRRVAGVVISKASTGKTAKIYFIVNGKTIDKITEVINLEKYNKSFGFVKKVTTKVKVKLTAKERKLKKYKGKKYKYVNKISYTKPVRSSSITKQNGKITFNIAGKKHVYEDLDISEMEVNEVTFTFGKYEGRTPLTYNGMYRAKFVNRAYDVIGDIENTFSAGDELIADCEDGSIYLNDLERQDLGALGNDWEDFYLQTGTNQIGVVWSDWA